MKETIIYKGFRIEFTPNGKYHSAIATKDGKTICSFGNMNEDDREQCVVYKIMRKIDNQ